MKKTLIAFCFFLFVFSSAQTTTQYNAGVLYLGVFDNKINDFASELKKDSDVLEFKKIDNDFYLYTIKDGKKSRMKFSLVGDTYLDEFGTKYLINEKDGSYYIFCLKELPNHKEKFLVLKVTDLRK